MVALNNQILSLLGVFFKINSMSSWKPMFNISSASSNTTYSIFSKLIAFLSIKSINRPGVATTTCTPLFKSLICIPMEVPPYTAKTCKPGMCFLNKFISFTICIHNSLVGQTNNACGYLSAVLINCNKGNPKAAVLPVPVCANPIKSLVPLIKTGMERSCISVACVYPNSETAFTNCSLIPISEKVFWDLTASINSFVIFNSSFFFIFNIFC